MGHMPDKPSDSNSRDTNASASSINLVRSSHTWTEADSAAGFVLRYLTPMRSQLTKILGSESEADEALKILMAHLVQAGFGEHKGGKLRDFLVKSIRSCAKARMGDKVDDKERDKRLEGITLKSKDWIRLWRNCLLERSWRALERYEHANPGTPVFAVLNAATIDRNATSQTLATRIRADRGIEIDAALVDKTLPSARAMFAQLIADEIVETLANPSSEDVKAEIKVLGIAHAFSGLSV